MSTTKLSKILQLLMMASSVTLVMHILVQRRSTCGTREGTSSFLFNAQVLVDYKKHSDRLHFGFINSRKILSAQTRGDSQSPSNVAETRLGSRQNTEQMSFREQPSQGSQSQSTQSDQSSVHNQTWKAAEPTNSFLQPNTTLASQKTPHKQTPPKSAEISEESLFHVDYTPSGTHPPHNN
ncbi:hypothetical protein O6H91_09G022500 [Diphasiastrum complanatum]|uniref:Uncharacterized protein n=1 Tax=Diphasiastrum complanatum TaxID=34168 RepID=A0ACC2CM53_DIPCM|nr:hypothetical protein O6H91_09G022500 [Diphasiastrum complanatum]